MGRRSKEFDVDALLDGVEEYLANDSGVHVPLADPEPDAYMTAQLASIAEYRSYQRQQNTNGDDGNTRGNLLFALLMLVLIAGPILVFMMGG